MQSEEIIQIKDDIPVTHFFIYKNSSYPFNFNLFEYYSNFIKKNQSKIKQNKMINIIDEDTEKDIELSKEIIQDFIKFVHRGSIKLNDANVLKLRYLADKFEITALFNYTEDYISKHQKDLIVDLLISYQNDPKSAKYEDYISNDFLYYIDNPKLLSLNFPIIYRISKKTSTNKNDKVIDFFFKCLNKYGRKASILFEGVDFMDLNSKYLNSIINDYSNIFDFHYINSSFAKSMYKIQSDVILNSEKIKEKLREQEEYNQRIQNENEELNKKVEKMEVEIKELKEMLNEQKINEFKNQLSSINSNIIQLTNKQSEFITKNDLKKVITEGQSYYGDELSRHATVPVNYENNYNAWDKAVKAIPS